MAFEIITQAPRPQKIIFGLVVLAILVAGGYFLLVSPRWEEVASLKQQRAAKEAERIQSEALASSLARFKQEADRKSTRLNSSH